ncbi:MAG: hypothetical protein R3C39_10670 [Dehalococcoidia bacterium]
MTTPLASGDAIECPGSTETRRHVIARDARVCHICGWVRGERDALSLHPQGRATPSAGHLRPGRWFVEALLVAASIGAVVAVAVAVAAGLSLS